MQSYPGIVTRFVLQHRPHVLIIIYGGQRLFSTGCNMSSQRVDAKVVLLGTSIIQVTATDADDPTYGNSARLVYTLMQGQQFFSVDPQTGILRTAVPDMDREDPGSAPGRSAGQRTWEATWAACQGQPPSP
ncbi:hypothetical protein SKAU_G00377590 [Synaphobranchus kaupii]|uniref:Cadherin domain-containing protein n=1 Tax=Synaphobranchus kaupii TaxID=118154 RepID=A0A9Q1IED3_SYNKA|nr:hypothetical protein SKAU_G00377590 [Synaphobranchus kaupii]